MSANRLLSIGLALLIVVLCGCTGTVNQVAAEEETITPAIDVTEAPPELPTASAFAEPVRPTAHYEPPALPATTLTDWEGTPYDDAAAGDAATLMQSSALVVVATLFGPERVYERPNAGWGYTSFTFSVERVLKGSCPDVLIRVLSPLTPQQFADGYNGYVDNGTLNSEMSVYTTLFPLAAGQRVLLMLQSVESPELLGGQAWACNGLRSTVLLAGTDGSLTPSDWVHTEGAYRPDPALRSLEDASALLAEKPKRKLPYPGSAPRGVYNGSVVYWRDPKAALLDREELDQDTGIRVVGSFDELTAAVGDNPGSAIWIDHTLAKGANPQWFARYPQRTLPVVLVGCYDSVYAFTSVLPIEEQFHEVGLTVTYGKKDKKPLGSGFCVFRCATETPELEDPVQLQIFRYDTLSVEGILQELAGMLGLTQQVKGDDDFFMNIAASSLNKDLTPGGGRELVDRNPYTLRQELGGGNSVTWVVRVIPFHGLPWVPPAMGTPQDATVMVSVLEDNQFQGGHKLTLYRVYINSEQRMDNVSPFYQVLTGENSVSFRDEEMAAAQVLSQIAMDDFPLSGSVPMPGCVGTGPDGKDVLLNETASTHVTLQGGGRYRVVFTRQMDILADPMTPGDDLSYQEKPENFPVLRSLVSTWEYELADGVAEAMKISVKSLNGLYDVEWESK